MPRKANDVKSEWQGERNESLKICAWSAWAKEREWERGRERGDRKGARARDNKSMLKLIITGLAISGDTNLRWPPFLRISLVSFSEAGRDTSLRRPIAIATFTGFQTDVGRNLFVIRISGTSPFYQRRIDARIAIDVKRPRPRLGSTLYIPVSAFPFLNLLWREAGRRAVPFYVCKNHKSLIKEKKTLYYELTEYLIKVSQTVKDVFYFLRSSISYYISLHYILK